MKNLEEERLIRKIIAEKFDYGNCPRCGTKVMIMKDKYKPTVTEVDRKYRGICNGCITVEEREEIFLSRQRAANKEETKNRLMVVK